MLKYVRKLFLSNKVKWAKRERVDKRVLNEWERTVHSCIDSKIQSLRKKHILKGTHHLNF